MVDRRTRSSAIRMPQVRETVSSSLASTPNVREVAAAMPERRLIPAIAEPVPSANPATVDALFQHAKKRWSEELAERGSAP